jgi:hypothetical protein
MSIAYWPAGTCGNDDVSSDIHDTHEAAEAVCRLLERKGFGGDGLVFPTHTEVSSVQGSVAASMDDTKRLDQAAKEKGADNLNVPNRRRIKP